MIWSLNFRKMKSCKNTKSFFLNILTIYTNNLPTYVLPYLLLPRFFSGRFLNSEQHSILFDVLARLDCNYMEVRMMKVGSLNFIWTEVFSQMKFIIFPGFPTKRAVLLTWSFYFIQSAPYLATFACSRMLSSIICLSPFFSEFSFYWLQHFFPWLRLSTWIDICVLNSFMTF